jgi:hypothetical protein
MYFALICAYSFHLSGARSGEAKNYTKLHLLVACQGAKLWSMRNQANERRAVNQSTQGAIKCRAPALRMQPRISIQLRAGGSSLRCRSN